jgi:hypothetical protein
MHSLEKLVEMKWLRWATFLAFYDRSAQALYLGLPLLKQFQCGLNNFARRLEIALFDLLIDEVGGALIKRKGRMLVHIQTIADAGKADNRVSSPPPPSGVL